MVDAARPAFGAERPVEPHAAPGDRSSSTANVATAGAASVPRPRLVDRTLAGAPVVLVEAGGGFGKTVLVDDVGTRAEGVVRTTLPRTDLVETDVLKALLLDAAEPDPGAPPRIVWPGEVRGAHLAGPSGHGTVVIDNVSSLGDAAARWLADLARDAAPQLRLVVSGRTMPEALAALELEGRADRIDTNDLRLTAAESRALVRLRLGDDDGERVWSALHHFSGGWVALLALVVRRLERAPDRASATADLLRHPALMGQLIDYYVSDLSTADQELFVQLAHFPMVSEAVADALGSRGLLRRLSQAGIPFLLGTDGWWRLSTTVKEHVTGRAPLDPDIAKHAAPLFVAHGAALTGAELLIESGDLDAAASLVAELPITRIESQDPRRLIQLVGRLGAAAETAPRCLLHLARVYGNVGMLGEERDIVDRASALVDRLPPGDDLAVEIKAESLFHRALLNDREAVRRIEALLDEARRGSRGRARLLEALGVALSDKPDERSLRRAENAMRQAALLWNDLGELSRAASVQRGLAVRVLSALGKFSDAAQLLRRLRAASETPYDRMLCLVFEARALALGGDDATVDAVVDEALSLADVLGIDWVAGHAAWTRLLVAANRDDVVMLREQLAMAETSLGQLAEDAGGVQFLCEAADACAALDEDADADRLLGLVGPRGGEDPVLAAFTFAVVDARRGRPGAADVLGRLVDEGGLPPGVRWKGELLRGHAALSAGDRAAAARSLEAALDLAARIGHPDLADRREARVLAGLRAAAAEARPAAPAGEGEATYSVAVLGGFDVRRRGELLASPVGRAAELLKRVALAGGRASVEVVVEAMWPDELPGVGLRRLKNVLSRSRTAYGPLIERRGNHLQLVDCAVDLVRFEDCATRVALCRGDERVRWARAALAAYTGPPLPDDVYDDEIDQRREAVRRRLLSVLDVLLTAALAAGDIDEALAVLQTATAEDPSDQERPLRVARALAAAGRDLEARGLARRAIAAAEEVGVGPVAEWGELDRSFDRP